MTQKKKKKNINLGLLIRVTFFFLLPLTVSAETIEKKYASFKLLNKTTNKVSTKDILVSSKISWETLNIEVLYCGSTPPTEIPEDYVLIDVYDTINNENTNILGIRLENRVKNSITTYHLHLLDLNEIQIEIPSTTFDYVIEMESIDFQKICRDMNNLAADTMEIKSIGEQLIFTCTSEFAQQETILRQSDDGLAYRESSDSIVQGLFRLKKNGMVERAFQLKKIKNKKFTILKKANSQFSGL